MKNYLRLLSVVIGPQYGNLLGVLMLFLLLSLTEVVGVGVIIPLVSSLNFGEGGSGEAQGQIILFFNTVTEFLGLEGTGGLLILMAFIFFTKAIIGYWTQRTIFKFGYLNQKRIIDSLVMKYQKIAVSEYSKMESSELIQDLVVNVEIITMGAIVASIRFVSETFVILAIAILLFYTQPLATMAMLCAFFLAITIYCMLFRGRIKKAGEDASESRIVVIKNFQALMHGFKEVHVIGRLSYFNKLIFSGTQRVKDSGVEYKSLSTMPRYIIELTAVTIFIMIFYMAELNGMKASDVIVLLGVFGVSGIRLIPGINQIVASLVQINNSSYALKKIYDGLNFKIDDLGLGENVTKKENSQSKIYDRKKVKTISLSDVQFSYEGSKTPTLSSVNMKIDQGGLICFIGESGSGKSTTFDLLLGFIQPEKGQVKINNTVFSDVNDWVDSFVYVPQEPFLFIGTIEENITLGLVKSGRGVSLEKALDFGCLTEFIDSLPDGLSTMLGERGVNISGGQRQRIALARAFYLDRPIMLLDEPTAALDSKIALRLIENIQKAQHEKMIIIATHDKKVMAICNHIYDFNNGIVKRSKFR